MQATSQTWKDLFAAGNARLETRATIAGTVYTQMSNPVITRALTQNGLTIGNAVSATCQFSVLTSDAIPRAAEVVIEQRLTDGTTTSEWLPAGTFYLSRRTRDAVTGLLTLECYDALLKGNAVWEPSSGTWPRNMSAVATELASLLNVNMDSRTSIPSASPYVMSAPEAGETINDALGTIAQACGGNWIITPAGELRLVPVVSAAGAASATSEVIDVTAATGSVYVSGSGAVTGIRDTWDGETYLTGDETGIVLDVSLAPVLAAELDALIGTTYQAYSLNWAIYDPAAELGDYVRGGAGGEVRSVLYSETATLGMAFRGDISAPEAGELADEYPYIGATQKALTLAKAYAQEAAADAVDGLDDELDQDEIFKRLTNNGAARGLVLLNGQLYVNASYIHSGTLVLGGLNNRDGLLEVQGANGNVIGTWSNLGLMLPGLGLAYQFFPNYRYSFLSFSGSSYSSGPYVRINNGELSVFNGSIGAVGVVTAEKADLTPTALSINARGNRSVANVDLKGVVQIIEGSMLVDENSNAVLSSGGLTIENAYDGQVLVIDRSQLKYMGGAVQFGTPLGIGSGGTGLTASPSMLVNLGSTSAANVLQASPRPGVTGTLPLSNGGTGATTASGARTNLGLDNTEAVTVTVVAGKIAAGTIVARKNADNMVLLAFYDIKFTSDTTSGEVIATLPALSTGYYYLPVGVSYTVIPLISLSAGTVLSAIRVDRGGNIRVINPNTSGAAEGCVALMTGNT